MYTENVLPVSSLETILKVFFENAKPTCFRITIVTKRGLNRQHFFLPIGHALAVALLFHEYLVDAVRCDYFPMSS